MAAPSRYNPYGLSIISFWRVSTTGIAHGQLDPAASLTPNTTSHALAFNNQVISAGLPEVSRKRVTFVGQSFLGSAFFGIADVPPFDIELAAVDNRLDAIANNGNIDTSTISGATITSPNYNNETPNDMGLMYSKPIQSRDTGTDGATSYETWVVPRCQINVTRIGGNTTDGENPQPVTVNVTPTMATKDPWGGAFGTNQGFAGNKNICYKILSPYPWGLTAWVANGSATSFITEFTPAYSTITSGNTNNVFSINGTVTAPTSFTIATKTIEVAAAGTTDDRHVAFYQIQTPIT